MTMGFSEELVHEMNFFLSGSPVQLGENEIGGWACLEHALVTYKLFELEGIESELIGGSAYFLIRPLGTDKSKILELDSNKSNVSFAHWWVRNSLGVFDASVKLTHPKMKVEEVGESWVSGQEVHLLGLNGPVKHLEPHESLLAWVDEYQQLPVAAIYRPEAKETGVDQVVENPWSYLKSSSGRAKGLSMSVKIGRDLAGKNALTKLAKHLSRLAAGQTVALASLGLRRAWETINTIKL